MKKIKKFIPLAFIFAIPSIAAAQSANLSNVQSLTTALGGIISTLMPIAFSLVFVVFFWGVAMFVVKAGDEEAQKKAKSIMIYGVIGIFVVASIWGLVAWLQSSLGVSGVSTGNIPTFR